MRGEDRAAKVEDVAHVIGIVAAEILPHLTEIPIVERIVEPCDPTGENLVLDDALAAKAGTDFEKVERLEIEIVGDLGIRRRGQPRALGGRGIDGDRKSTRLNSSH